MSQTERTGRAASKLDTPEKRLAEATKQLRIAREALDDQAGSAHVEVAIREAEAARYHLE